MTIHQVTTEAEWDTAYADALPGDTIQIMRSWTASKQYIITKRLTVEGVDNPAIVQGASYNNQFWFEVGADGSICRNFSLVGTKDTYSNGVGILVSVNSMYIYNMHIRNFYDDGIGTTKETPYVNGLIIEGCTVTGSGRCGIRFYYVDDSFILDNHVVGVGLSNTQTGAQGIHLIYSNRNLVRGNAVYNSSYTGINMLANYGAGDYNDDNIVEHNYVENWNYVIDGCAITLRGLNNIARYNVCMLYIDAQWDGWGLEIGESLGESDGCICEHNYFGGDYLVKGISCNSNAITVRYNKINIKRAPKNTVATGIKFTGYDTTNIYYNEILYETDFDDTRYLLEFTDGVEKPGGDDGIEVGDTVYDVTSGNTATVETVVVYAGTSWAGSDAEGYCHVYNLSGSFTTTGDIKVPDAGGDTVAKVGVETGSYREPWGLYMRPIAGQSNAPNVYNNTIYSVGTQTHLPQIGIYMEDLSGASLGNAQIKNNIIVGFERGLVLGDQGADGLPGGLDFDYNCYYNINTNEISEYNGTPWSGSFDDVTHSPSGNDIASDPLLKDPTNFDFRLKVGSPCLDAGTDVSLTQDIIGSSVPRLFNPSIGAYENPYSAFEMFDYLENATPDIMDILDTRVRDPGAVSMVRVLSEVGFRNQVEHTGDDGSDVVLEFHSDIIFHVEMDWAGLEPEDAGSVFDLYFDFDKAARKGRTFRWKHPSDGHTYVARFDMDLDRRVHPFGDVHGIPNLRLKVLGRVA